MKTFVALLRAVNVGGTGKLPMAVLRAMCEAEGFAKVRTYIASGNVIFDASGSANQAKSKLEKCLAGYAGKPVGVMIRSREEMVAVGVANPFFQAEGNRVSVIFLDDSPAPGVLEDVRGRVDEELALGGREIYVHYPSGMADSRLRIPSAQKGTARNMNTVLKLAEMALDR